ncbi:hypothetical protein N7472_010947 [Penicillium cf. griseofulvum]|uniref:Major facilitator superfamily (MFS) profile domain-containing protein n=1 Tax=Penicillium cf. griseofulvum TaxID=2972120 RepID=A0A9W9IXT9_9EURO|nr:hypothetical protein N7472_010947 [Penicillium cf. griseofulvum]
MLEETTPLLGRQQKATRWLSICWLSAVVFCLSAAGAFLNVPLTRLIEDRLCSRYVRQGAPSEELCKTDKIQSRLAYLNGCLPVVEAVVGSSELSSSWLVRCLLSPGGGNTVLLANLYSIASDLVVQSDRASTFFLLAFASLVGASVGPAISSICIEAFSPWVSAFIAFFVNLVALIPLFFVPETLSTLKQDSNSEQESEDEPPAPEVLDTFQFLAQYIGKRFDWPLARTGYLLTLRGVIHMVVLLFTLPLLSRVLLRYQPSPVKDLTLARVSVATAAVGALCMASSQIGLVITGLAIHSLGSGLAPLCHLLATSYVVPHDTSKLNTVIGIVQTTGSLFAGPAFAWLFETGMKLGGTSLGLPYYGLAGSFMLCLVGLVFVHPPAQGEEIDET